VRTDTRTAEAAAVRALGELVPPKPMVVLRADFGGEIDASAATAA
jgi:hypothetical protein